MPAAKPNPAARAEAVPVQPWSKVLIVSWLIPGGGHFLLKRTGRGAVLMGTIVLMFALGLLMRGVMFHPQRADLLTTIITYGGFLGDLASGLLYLLAYVFGYVNNVVDVAGHVHDYGTKFLVAAGLLNILAMIDAYEIAKGKKE
jgi:hypothetical protein